MDDTGSGHTGSEDGGLEDNSPGTGVSGSDRSQEEPGHIQLAPIDHEEYDALADLFLGDGGYAPDPIGSLDDGDPTDREDSVPTHATHTPVLQLTRHEDDALLGEQGFEQKDEPFEPEGSGMRVLESLETTGARASALLAELLGQRDGIVNTDLMDQDGLDEIEIVEMPKPRIEVVVLGHLPVRATLWARQYACSLARERLETVALIRAASGSTSIDLITGEEPISTRSYVHLDGAIEAVSKLADRVVLRVDEASEPELLDRAEVEEITILTGADEAAVVASYRLIKTLDATLGEQYEPGDGPVLRLAVMGAGTEQSQDACTKLENAVDTFIERPIEIVVGAGRIDATGTMNLYRDSVAHRASDIIDGLVGAARRDASPTELQLADVEEEEVQEVENLDGGRDIREDNAERVVETNQEPAIVEFPSGGAIMPEPQKMDRVESGDDAPTMRDGLCALIPGLNPIEARCPKAPGVELAIDDRGRLQLIVCDADTRDAMNRLLAAQTWARNNLGLLIRAEPGLAAPSADRDVDTDALMHLISDEPRALHEIFDTQVRVYALARVKVGKVIAQVATPIN